jgi:hypothetical protein
MKKSKLSLFYAYGFTCLFFSGSPALDTLPQGPGIAWRYDKDSGIMADTAVVFADNFETYTQPADLWKTYYNVFQESQIRIVRESDHVYSGGKALEFTLPQQSAELSNGVQVSLTKQRDLLFLRYYTKFDTTFDITGSCHNGGGISAHYFNGYSSTPGVPANGYNKFLVEFECWRGDAQTVNPGQFNVYIYHPEQRSNYGDHFFPNGQVMPNTSLPNDFGPDFVSRPHKIPQLGRWYCHEVMLKANTVGKRDGRVACWLDGSLIADFPNLRLRDVDTLKIDRFNVSFHAGSNPVRATRKWYDNIVAATAYIGPLNTGTPNSVLQPSGLKTFNHEGQREGFAGAAVFDLAGRRIGLEKRRVKGNSDKPIGLVVSINHTERNNSYSIAIVRLNKFFNH